PGHWKMTSCDWLYAVINHSHPGCKNAPGPKNRPFAAVNFRGVSMARIALIGASGQAGSRILQELANRGHQVTAIARNTARIASLPNVTAVSGDVYDKGGLVALLKGHDAVISSVHFS